MTFDPYILDLELSQSRYSLVESILNVNASKLVLAV